jgi:hypothetical protein
MMVLEFDHITDINTIGVLFEFYYDGLSKGIIDFEHNKKLRFTVESTYKNLWYLSIINSYTHELEHKNSNINASYPVKVNINSITPNEINTTLLINQRFFLNLILFSFVHFVEQEKISGNVKFMTEKWEAF